MKERYREENAKCVKTSHLPLRNCFCLVSLADPVTDSYRGKRKRGKECFTIVVA